LFLTSKYNAKLYFTWGKKNRVQITARLAQGIKLEGILKLKTPLPFTTGKATVLNKPTIKYPIYLFL
jgi:hypothetical protein